MKNQQSFIRGSALVVLASLFIFSISVFAQTPKFTYRGRLTDLSMPADTRYDFEVKLFTAVSGGTPLGTDSSNVDIYVDFDRDFTLVLDFGSAAFDGSDRYLEIGVKRAGIQTPYTLLTPRALVTSAPYAIRSLKAGNADTATNATNTTQLGGVAANQYVQTNDSRMTDARDPLPNSSNYIQNTTTQQSSSNFNISGNGTAGGTLTGDVVNATTQFNLGGYRILHSQGGSGNLFAGITAGGSNTTGTANTFFGYGAGAYNTGGFQNSIFGSFAGWFSSTGSGNSFFGFESGRHTSRGTNNSFFGSGAGLLNTTGNFNSFFGHRAGEGNNGFGNNNGSFNSFFGTGAGLLTDSGNSNSFIGHDAGNNNISGSFNTVVGENSDVEVSNLTNATAIGSKALVSQSNSLVLGSINGVNGATADTKVGLGTTTPLGKLQVVTANDTTPSTIFGWDARHFVVGGSGNTGGIGLSYDQTRNVGYIEALSPNQSWRNLVLQSGGGNLGIGTTVPESKLHVNGSEVLSTGPSSGFKFRDRGGSSSADDWVWYSSGNIARLWRAGVGDLMTIDGDTGVLRIGGPAVGGGNRYLCLGPYGHIAWCSSSLRYKTNIAQFSSGLSFINQLRPITFDWKEGGMKDVGFGAEDVAKLNPLFVTYNSKGEVEGVKYDRLSVAFVNAFKEQQTQIEQQQTRIEQQQKLIEAQQRLAENQQRQIENQQRQIDALKKLVCSMNPTAEICK